MNNYLMTIANGTLKDANLKENLLDMVSAEQLEQSGVWKFATALHSIIKEEQYKQDFEKKGKFAKAVGLSAGRISQCVGAVDFIAKHEQFKGLTVENSYLLNSISVKENGKRVNKTDDFLDALDAKNVDVMTLTTARLKEFIKKYKEAFGSEVVDTEAEAIKPIAKLIFAVGIDEELGNYIIKADENTITCSQPKTVIKALADIMGVSVEMTDDKDLTEMEKEVKTEEKPKRKGASTRKSK